MITIEHTQYGETATLTPVFGHYAGGRLAVQMFDVEEGPYTKVTVNLPDEHLNAGEVFIKDWAENEKLVAHLLDEGWLEDTGREVLSGYVSPKVMRLAGPLLEAFEAATSNKEI